MCSSDLWIEQARKGGLIVQELQAYCALECSPDEASARALAHCKLQNLAVSVVVTSTANASRLAAWAQSYAQPCAQSKPETDLLPWLRQQTMLAIHPRIAAALNSLSFAHVKEIAPGLDALRTAALTYGN